nr:tetratricopeptide repeat-containing glycosyltransferase family protein [uncultured Holophaga sp.]
MNTVPEALLRGMGEALGHHRRGALSSAILAYRRVLSQFPGQCDALANLGAIYKDMGRLEEAEPLLLQALGNQPGHPGALCNLGGIRLSQGRCGEARELLERSLALEPGDPVTHSNLGALELREGHLGAALRHDEAALALAPERAELHQNHGFTLMRAGRLSLAEEALGRALECDPESPGAHWNLAYVRLLQGRYLEAWPDFAWRLLVPGAEANLRDFAQPRWRGEPFAGRTLLVWSEQGFGDTLQFVRYLPQVKALGGRVALLTYPNLKRLLSHCPGLDELVIEGGPLPEFDLQIPLLELPALFASTLETLPRGVPYLQPPPLSPELDTLLTLGGSRKRIGLVWSGNPGHQDDARRSLDPTLLAPLMALPDAAWYSLQVGGAPAPESFGLIPLSSRFRDFADTAAAIASLDHVLSVDTAVLHLAGALGRPASLLLPFFPDWRWLMEGGDCPWYPSVRVFRQTSPGDWEGVIARLYASLEATSR